MKFDTKRAWHGARSITLLGLAGLAAFGIGVRHAQACGGLFCDGPPANPFSPLPVAQNGENVVFAIDKDPTGGASTLTVHIQILYTGDAAQFSWILPVDAMPGAPEVGTDTLFASLLTATQPRFQANTVTDGQCLPEPGCANCDGRGGPTAGSAGGSLDAGIAPPKGTPDVNVSFRGAVGPYDAAVIQSTDPMALKNWLTTNGYVVSDAAAQIIDAYVRENKFFVALKLLNGMGVSAIQPIVLKFISNEPCIPLRLTAIAANPDMPVRLWVLAAGRVVPRTFLEVKVDEARIDWTQGGSNYASLTKSLLGEAADEAGGNAFVTEYAGPTAPVAANLLWSEGRFDISGLQAAQTPPAYIQALINLGLASNAQVLPLLSMYIPMPAELKAMGITDAQFYGNIKTYWGQYAFPGYVPANLATLTTKISDNVIAPLKTAQLMIDGHSYLTRMNTFISPAEMNQDALFFANTGLGDVPLLHTATFRVMCGDMKFMACNAPMRLELADGRMAWVRSGSKATTCSYRSPDLSGLAKLPAAEMAWQRDATGAGTVMVDNTQAIQAGLAVNNSAFPAEQNMFPSPTSGGGMLTSSGGGGCSCAVAGGAAGGAGFGAAGLVAGLLWARRRRARR